MIETPAAANAITDPVTSPFARSWMNIDGLSPKARPGSTEERRPPGAQGTATPVTT
jgi:hypothetical protein